MEKKEDIIVYYNCEEDGKDVEWDDYNMDYCNAYYPFGFNEGTCLLKVAKHYLDQGDSYNPNDWPRVFNVHNEKGELIARGKVDMYYEPAFSVNTLPSKPKQKEGFA